MMRLVLDLELVQAEPKSPTALFMLALTKQLIFLTPKNAELIIVLSAAFPGSIEPLRGEFQDLLPQGLIRVWQPPAERLRAEQDGLRRVAARLHQAFIAEMQPDLIILPNPLDDSRSYSLMSGETTAYNSALAVLIAIQGGGESAGVRRNWPQKRLERLGGAIYLLEVPGLTVLADRLEQPAGLHRVLLPKWGGASGCQVDAAAQRLWELVHREHIAQAQQRLLKRLGRKPRLAYVSPLPPEQTGIGYYSAELLPELALHYDIDVVVNQSSVEDEWISTHCGIKRVEWFERHGHEYDRVVYQFGNSRFHAHMWNLIEMIPGVAVVHDFYLGDAVAYREDCGGAGLALPWELYRSHGYAALKPLLRDNSRDEAVRQFPCSYSPIREAKGVIVHSRHAQHLVASWYGVEAAKRIHVIPHLRKLSQVTTELRIQARERLGIRQNVFLVCSFGVVNRTKLNDRLFSAWQRAQLGNEPYAQLVFVGETPDEYGMRLRQEVETSKYRDRICFTGWADSGVFQDYLAAADIAVQLRTDSRGETSGTVLDCMAHGVATICNAHGSFAELPEEGVWKLDDRFTDEALIEALDSLWRDNDRREALRHEARQQIQRLYSPACCSERYFEAIEQAYMTPSRQRIHVVQTAVEELTGRQLNEPLAASIGTTLPVRLPQKQLLVDVSVIARQDLRTGVQRVVRSILNQFFKTALVGVRVEPVYTNPAMRGYMYARQFTQHFMDGSRSILPDEPIEAHSGDVFIGLDLHTDGISTQCSYLEGLRDKGVKVMFVVHDLLPVTHPHWFPAQEEQAFENWLHCITRFDGAICVSQSTADELNKWMISRGVRRHRPYLLAVAHNGADIRQSVPSMGLPGDAEEVLAKVRSKSSFLMVGTIEPRKGVAQVLDAFELLWQQGHDMNLVLVGKHGWNVDELAKRIEQHGERGRRIFWLQGISDEYLVRVYADCTCLIAASEGEGFGLPLIEAAQQKIPILARDIKIFREVAGGFAEYFKADTAEGLASSILSWCEKYKNNQHIRSENLRYMTWDESARKYLNLLLYQD